MKTAISSKGQIVLRQNSGKWIGSNLGRSSTSSASIVEDYRLVGRVAPRNEGAIAWLLTCPYKDFFVPIDSESTDTL